MKTKFLIGMLTLLALVTTSACSQTNTTPAVKKGPAMLNQTVPSYIAKVKGDGDSVIRRVFAQFGIVFVRSLGNDYFELRLERDPGLESLKNIVDASEGAVISIQPNFVYGIN